MHCKEFRSILPDLVDGRVDVRANEHLSECPSCTLEYDEACDAAQVADDVIRSLAPSIRPNDDRRQAFVRSLRAPRRLPLFAAAAGAALLLVAWLSWPAPTAVDPKAALVIEAQKALLHIPKTGNPAVDDQILLATIEIEEALAQELPPVEISFDEAEAALHSDDVARRAAARKVLADSKHPDIVRYRSARERAGQRVASIRRNTVSNGRWFEYFFEQFRDGSIHLVAKEGNSKRPDVTEIKANDWAELIAGHADLCRRLELIDSSGRPKVGVVIPSLKSLPSVELPSTWSAPLRKLDPGSAAKLEVLLKRILALQNLKKSGK